MSGSRKRRRRTIDPGIPGAPAVGVALLAGVVLGCAAGGFPVAGISARLLEKHLWLDALSPATNPLWGMGVRAVAGLVPWAPFTALNLSSVVCGVGASVLMFYLNARLLQLLLPGRSAHVYILCGFSAALYLMVSTPFWIVGSRAHPLSFDVLLLLLAIFLQSEYQRTRRARYLNAFAFVFGVGVVEYPVFLIVAWPLAILTLLLMRRRGHLRRSKRKKYLLTGTAWGVAGILVVLAPACWQLTHSPARLWMDDPGGLHMLRLLVGAEWRQVVGSFPKTGWMLIGMVSIAPWAVCLMETRRSSSLRDLPSFLLYVVLSALPLLILFHGPIAPFEVLGNTPLVVAPYLFVASSFGLLVSYWRLTIWWLWRRRNWPFRGLRHGLAMLLPASAMVAPVFNISRVSPEPTRVLYECATEILNAMGEREWLVTDGSLDSLLRLAAFDQGRTLHLLNVGLSSDDRYRRVLASQFSDPRLRSLAGLGPLPLLREFLQTDAGITENLAFMNTGNMWLWGGYLPVPERLVYLGRPPESALENSGIVLERNAAFWDRAVPRLRHTENVSQSHGLLARHLRWQISRVANDLGITLQRAGEEDLGRQAFLAARAANDLNASAIINLGGAGETDFAQEIQDELDLPLPVLILRHGHVRRISDLPDRDQSGDQTRVPMSDAVRRRFMEVSSHLKSGDLPRCAEALEHILMEDPSHSVAWYLRGLLASLNGQDAVWDKCWRFMLTQPKPWTAFLLIQGERHLREGNVSDGLSCYEEAFQLRRFDPRIVRRVAMAEFMFGSSPHAETYVTQLLSLDPSDPWGNFALGSIQFGRGENELAESSLRVAVDQLRVPDAHGNLAWVLVLNGKMEEARQQVAAALSLDPDFAPAWDTMGVIHMKNGNLDDAEIAFQRSLQLSPDNWDARVHHARLDLAVDRTRDAQATALALEKEAAGKSLVELAEYLDLRRDLGLPPLTTLE